MSITEAKTTLDALREQLAHDVSGLRLGLVPYEKAKATAKAYASAALAYSKLRWPDRKHRLTPYQSLLR